MSKISTSPFDSQIVFHFSKNYVGKFLEDVNSEDLKIFYENLLKIDLKLKFKSFKIKNQSVKNDTINGRIILDKDKNKILFFSIVIKQTTLMNTIIHLRVSDNPLDFTLLRKILIPQINTALTKIGIVFASILFVTMFSTEISSLFIDDIEYKSENLDMSFTVIEQELSIATIYEELDEPKIAIEHYNNVLNLDPGNIYADVNRKIAYSDLEKYRDIQRTYESVLVFVPNFKTDLLENNNVDNNYGLHDPSTLQVFFYPEGIDGPEIMIPREYVVHDDVSDDNLPTLSHSKIDPSISIVYPKNLDHYPSTLFSDNLQSNHSSSLVLEKLQNNDLGMKSKLVKNETSIISQNFNNNNNSKSVELFVSQNDLVKIEYVSGPDGPLVIYPYYSSTEKRGPVMTFPERSFYPFLVWLGDQSFSRSNEQDESKPNSLDNVNYSVVKPAIDYKEMLFSVNNSNKHNTLEEIKKSEDVTQPIKLIPDDGDIPVEFPLGLDYLYILEPPITKSESDARYYRDLTGIDAASGNEQSVDSLTSGSSKISSFSPPLFSSSHQSSSTGSGIGGGGGGALAMGGSFTTLVSGGSGGSSRSSSCNNECTPPTLGFLKNDNSKQMVQQGFSYNGYATDVESFYTPFPLLGVNIGQQNVATFKIYDNQGPHKIQHVGLAFSLDHNESFNESEIRIELDRNSIDETFSTTIYDPNNILDSDSVSIATDITQCTEDSANNECLLVSINHTFRAPLEFNRFATYVWDDNRNGWQNYFNHGIKTLGESMNPPSQHMAFHKGHPVTITEIPNTPNKAVDKDDNTWTFDGSFWRMDYISKGKIAKGITMHGIDRNNVLFGEYIVNQTSIAEDTFHKKYGSLANDEYLNIKSKYLN